MFDNSKCRLCATIKSKIDLINIKNDNELKSNLEYKIFYCFQIQISENDFLPTCICTVCCAKVNYTYEFAAQVHKAQRDLLESKICTTKNVGNTENYKAEYSDTDELIDENQSDTHILNFNDDFLDVKEELRDYGAADDVKPEIKDTKDFSDEENSCTTRKNRIGSKVKLDTPIKTKKSSKYQDDEDNLLIKIFREWENYKWKCQDCIDEFSTVKDLRQHYNEIHKKSAVYTCMECGKVLYKYDGFQKHVRNHRNKHKFCCEICGKFSYNKEHHERHKETHSDTKKFMCSICGNHFKTPASLKSHEKLHLPPELREQYECDICHKKLASQPSLWSHKKLHTGIKEHTCDICGKIFAQKTNLIQHVSLHKEGLPFHCDLCPRKFKTARRLKRHQIIHTNIKPYKCDTCGKTFRAKQTLNDHKAIHVDHFPYECEHCKKGFKLRQLLKVHLRQHTGERPYACVECNHRFANWSNYNKHMKGRHGINMKSPVTQLIHEQQQRLK